MRPPEFWDHRVGRASAPLLRAGLAPLSWLITAAGRWRWRRATPAKAPVPVICIGNVTLGGTGKTPLALALAALLQAQGHRPVFLSRGHGGRARGPLVVDPDRHDAALVGDEALLLAAAAPAIIARDRVAGARLAAAQNADLIIMDDGFQNPALHKDASLLVLDTQAGLGNGRVFPAGPLREPLADALARADALVAMGTGPVPVNTALPVLRARLVNEAAPPPGPLFAFAGIGRPQKVFDALQAAGADLVQAMAFADHHRYSARELRALRAWAEAENARLITTEKDHVRLPQAFRGSVAAWPVRARLEAPERLMALLQARGVL